MTTEKDTPDEVAPDKFQPVMYDGKQIAEQMVENLKKNVPINRELVRKASKEAGLNVPEDVYYDGTSYDGAGGVGASQAKKRPGNFEALSAREQWEIDKELGILDWNGK